MRPAQRGAAQSQLLMLALVALTGCALEQRQLQVSGSYYTEVGERLINTVKSLTTTTAAQATTTEASLATGLETGSTSGQPETESTGSEQATGVGRDELPPSKGEFVKLDTAPELVVTQQSNSAAAAAAEESTSVSANAASDSDPTSTVAIAAASEATSGAETAPAGAQQPAAEVVTEGVAEATTSEAPSARPTQPDSPAPQLPPEEAVRETELEAVAAVDASIGFGDLFGSLNDACYDEYGNARYCEPPFENAAFEKQVEVSSECGSPASRFCTAYHQNNNHQQQAQVRNCHMCDAQHPKKRHPAAYLTDLNNSNNPTCWVSAPISGSQQASNNISNSSDNQQQQQQQQQQQLKSDNVTLVLNLEKKYEITYISMQFCSVKPDSLAIYKSTGSGEWSPFQFYSSQCRRMYGRPAQVPDAAPARDFEPFCTNSSSVGANAAGVNSARIAFSTLENRPGAHSLDRSAQLQDWMTARSIKVVLERHQANWIHAQMSAANFRPNSTSDYPADNSAAAAAESSPLTSPSDTYNYAISDLTVGGRCKCNGHASRCVHSKEGRLQCDCRHNTAGEDCERCAAFHFDRPWARATQLDANPCQPCNCNGHSRKCRFDPDLYKDSGRRSGGVCTNCRDNTIGRHCQYCRLGFARDHSKPMSDKEACKHCDCHPIGSLGPVCNQTSGQCLCKEGVTGLQCSRCSPGYQQSSSLSEPCIKLPENDINYEPSLTVIDSDLQSATEPAPDNDPEANELPDRAAPPGGATNSLKPLHKDPDSVNEIPDELPPPPRRTRPPPSYWPKPGAQLPVRKGNRHPSRHDRPQMPFYNLEEQEPLPLPPPPRPPGRDSGEDSLDEDNYPQLQQPNAAYSLYSPAPYNTYYLPHPSYGHQGGRGQQSPYGPMHRQHHRQDHLSQQMKPFVDLDQGAGGGYTASVDEPEVTGYHMQPMGPVYGEATFNQIRASHEMVPNGRYRPGGRPLAHTYRPQQAACADCQASTRKLKFKQFCRLDYAIKAKILRTNVNDDWTRFEVGIQDIFKSPSLSSTAHSSSPSSSSPMSSSGINYLDNILLADEPPVVDQQRAANQTASGAQLGGNRGAADENADRHLRVGTKRSILLPTEDLTCECPKLQVGSIYLLLGSIDAKEDSEIALQLDRHGVALEWRPRLLERLVKYQRSHSRGKCNN